MPTQLRPPRHLADLSTTERRAAVVAAGQPAYRADQLSRHYFARLADEPAQMTDVPAAIRFELADVFLPPVLTPVRHLDCDSGTTRKTLWRGARKPGLPPRRVGEVRQGA